tara:strand:+ start:8070 stop:8306 length:237 start_codon:yes stop_codon:yes gene_type:complete
MALDFPGNPFFEKKNKSDLYKVLFHYSHYKMKWFCFNRDEKDKYFNGKIKIVGEGESVEDAFLNYQSKKNEQSRKSTS